MLDALDADAENVADENKDAFHQNALLLRPILPFLKSIQFYREYFYGKNLIKIVPDFGAKFVEYLWVGEGNNGADQCALKFVENLPVRRLLGRLSLEEGQRRLAQVHCQPVWIYILYSLFCL